MTTISQATLRDIEEIKVFYSLCGYGGGLSEKDTIFIARFEKRIVAAVRLCPEIDFFVLRGMQVFESFQRQGTGTRLLQVCIGHLANQVCYCIPWQHLNAFYQQARFQEVSSDEVPALLNQRFNDYLSRRMKVILMRRLP